MALFTRLDQLLFSVSVARLSTGYARGPCSRLFDNLFSELPGRLDCPILIANSDSLVCWWPTDKLHVGSLGGRHGFTGNDLDCNAPTQAGQQHVANRLGGTGLYYWNSVVGGSYSVRDDPESTPTVTTGC